MSTRMYRRHYGEEQVVIPHRAKARLRLNACLYKAVLPRFRHQAGDLPRLA